MLLAGLGGAGMTGTVAAEIRDAVERVCCAVDESPSSDGFDESAWRRLEEAGFTLVGIPEQHGGAGGTLADAADVLRAAARQGVAVPLAETMWLGAWLLADSGLHVPAGPLTAAAADGDVMLTAASGGGWLVEGVLRRVPWARHATDVVILATSHDGPVVIRLPTRLGDIRPGHNLAGEPRDDVRLASVWVSDDDVAPAGPHVDLTAWSHRAALARVVALSGASEQVLRLCISYATDRRQFGRPLISFQAIQERLARLAGEVAVLVVSCQAAVHALSQGSTAQASVAVAAARAAAGESAGVVAGIGHQIHGAMGMTFEHSLHRSTTRLWAWREEYGNEQVHYRRLGEFLAKHDPWELISGAWLDE